MLIQRTTLKIDQQIYKLAKKKAVDQEISLQNLINNALKQYLTVDSDDNIQQRKEFKFGNFDLGKLKEKIDRKTLYEERPKTNPC